MKKISILSLILLGGLYISNANALQTGGCNGEGFCYVSSTSCASFLTYDCQTLAKQITGSSASDMYQLGKVSYSKCKDKFGDYCWSCSATCTIDGTQYTVDTTSSDKPTLSADPNFGTITTTTSTTAPKSKNLKK